MKALDPKKGIVKSIFAILFLLESILYCKNVVEKSLNIIILTNVFRFFVVEIFNTMFLL